jgi:predicted regulator of Ras-like GTPase activity (Roadblock/LC7/MglB family)
VGRLSALTSSVFSVAGAHRKAIMAQSDESTVVNISSGDSQTVLLAVNLPGLGHFVLGAYADDISLGLLIIEARRTARRIASHLTVPIP